MSGSWLQARSWLRLSRDQIIIAGCAFVAAGAFVVTASAWWGGADLVLPTLGSVLAGVGMGLQSASTSLATMQLSPTSEIGRNTSSLQVGETTGNALFTGLAGTIFAALKTTAPDAVTFGSLMMAMAMLGLAGALAALRIGHVTNHSFVGGEQGAPREA